MRHALSVLVVIAALGASASISGLKPLAISVFTDGKIFIPSPDRINIADPVTQASQTISISPTVNWFDAVAAGASTNPTMFMLGQGTLAASSPVTQFDARGKELRSWYLPIGYPSGIAFDRVKQVLYVTELLSAEVYTINVLEKGGGPHYLAEVWGAKRAGPVAVDTGTGKIFVADRFTGNVYQMIPPAYRSKLLVGDLGEPSGLAVSPGGQDLYVADHFKRCIWIVRLDEKTAHATKFLAPDLRGPTGVAVDGDGVVWIADESAVFGVTKQGKLLHTIR